VDGVREDVQRGELVVVSSEKGEELVEVLGYSKEGLSSRATFLRRAMEEDKRKAQGNEGRAKEFHQLCKRKIREYNLDMKLLKTYIPLDGSKVFFYYTAEQRVDFRALVRDLAKSLKKRIEMRQIGVRDAVQMMGWLGNCGNDACCAKFAEKNGFRLCARYTPPEPSPVSLQIYRTLRKALVLFSLRAGKLFDKGNPTRCGDFYMLRRKGI